MATDTTNRNPKPRTGEIGRTGTVNTDGFIQSLEKNRDLQWPKSLEVFDEMRRTDASVRGSLAYLTMPIRAADWEPEPVSEEDEDVEVSAAVRGSMECLEGGWDDFVRRLLTYLPLGFYVGEEVWAYGPVEVDGDKRDMFYVRKVADRLQRTIEKWHMKKGELVSIEQWVDVINPGDATNPVIPRNKCILLVNEQEGDDFYGTSILRSAYGSWQYKRKLELAEALAIQKRIGVPVVYTPQSADDVQLDDLEEALNKLNSAENMYLIMPGMKQQSGNMNNGEGWLVDWADVSTDGGAEATDKAITRHDSNIARNVVAEFMRLGHNDTGARATSESQSDPYKDALKAVCRNLEDVIHDEYTTPFVRYNFGEDVAVPRIKAVGLEKVDAAALADAFQKFSSAITMDAKTEAHIRSVLGFPEISEEDREKIKEENIKRAQEAGEPLPGQNTRKAPSDPAKKQEDNAAKGGKFSAPRTDPFEPWRELTALEQCVAFAAIDKTIDAKRLEFQTAGEVFLPEYAAALASGASIDTALLEIALYGEMAETATYGAEQVGKELDRQKAVTRETFETYRLPESATEQLRRRAKLAAQAVVTAVGVAVGRVKIDQLRRRGDDALDKEIEAGIAAGRAALRNEALENVTASLNTGRDAKAKQVGVADAVYSSVLDSGTCGPCAGADGTEAPVGSGEYDTLTPPHPDCQGAGRCRCIWVYVGDETT